MELRAPIISCGKIGRPPRSAPSRNFLPGTENLSRKLTFITVSVSSTKPPMIIATKIIINIPSATIAALSCLNSVFTIFQNDGTEDISFNVASSILSISNAVFSIIPSQNQVMYKEVHQVMILFNSNPRIDDYHNNIRNQAAEKGQCTVQ